MSYGLARTESVADGIRRIVVEEVRSASDKIDAADMSRDDKVHEVRKHCKKIRGALRLVRPSLEEYAALNERIRDIGRLLSEARDARVLHDIHGQLLDELGWAPDEADARDMDAALAATASNDSRTDRALAEARERLDVIAADATRWEVSADGIEAISGGLRKTYKRARKAGRRCLDDPSDEQLHEWRKRVKYHWYHLRLLVNAWPRVLKARVVAAHHLSALLGDDHDLAVYRQAMDATAADIPGRLAKKVRDQIALQRRLLQLESNSVGARLFAEKPRHFVRRIEKYWEVWRQPGLQRIP